MANIPNKNNSQLELKGIEKWGEAPRK